MQGQQNNDDSDIKDSCSSVKQPIMRMTKMNNIEVDNPTPMPKTVTSKTIHTNLDDENASNKNITDLRLQNRKLKIINKDLRKKMQDFQSRLDLSLRKRKDSENKHKVGQEIVESMELKNAYKMCEIYKKEISFLKRRQSQTKQGRVEELQNIIEELEKEKEKLILEVRDLKRMNKQQQKGFKMLAGPNVMKIMNQNQQLKQQIRKLQDCVDKDPSSSLKKISYEKRKDKSYDVNSRERFKSLHNDGDDHIENLKSKILKDNRKISILTAENSKLRDNIEELRNQIIDRDKEFLQLRERFLNVAKRVSSKPQKKFQTEPDMAVKTKKHIVEKDEKKSNRSHRRLKSEINQSQVKKSKNKKHGPSQSYSQYPKLLQSGYSNDHSFKWNHKSLSSKIIEVQVCPHSLGHIKEVNFRYQKGEPQKLSNKQYACFFCDVSAGEFIKCIRGGFKSGLLRYLSIETNKGRKSNFCEYELEDQCHNFEYQSQKNEYIGAFFGQNLDNGICRIGCYLEYDQ